MATAMGDVYVWQGGFLRAIKYRKGIVDVVAAKSLKFFFPNLSEGSFAEKLSVAPYPEAAARYGAPAFDECFAYTPLLALGGKDSVDSLEKVKLVEHIRLIAELAGPVE